MFVTSTAPVIGGGYHGYIQGSAGNYDYFGAQGAVNLPLTDTLAARVAFNADFRDSFYDITGPYTGDDGVRKGSGRLGVLWEPSVGVDTFRDSVDDTIYSQEFNLISPDSGPMTWILGAYYQHDTLDFPDGEFVIGVPGPDYILQAINVKETAAVFGQVTFDLPQGFEVQLGARYVDSSSTNDGSINQYGLPLVLQQTESWSNLSGKLARCPSSEASRGICAFAARQ